MSNPDIGTNRARQGHWGRHVFLILIAALLLVGIGWAVVEMYGESIDNNAEGQPGAATTNP